MRVYARLLSLPGAWQFSLAGAIARYPMAMLSLSIALMIPLLYANNYTLAGQVSAAYVAGYALGAPVISRIVDRAGQARVLSKTLSIFVVALLAMAVTANARMHPAWVIGATIIAGLFTGSLGAVVRSRWAHLVDSPADISAAFALESANDEMCFTTAPVLAAVLVTSVHPVAGLVGAAVITAVGATWLLMQKATEPPVAKPSGESRRWVMRSGGMAMVAAD